MPILNPANPLLRKKYSFLLDFNSAWLKNWEEIPDLEGLALYLQGNMS